MKTWIVNFDDHTIEHEYECLGHDSRILSAVFLDNKQTLVTLSSDETIIFWDISPKKQDIHELIPKSKFLTRPVIR